MAANTVQRNQQTNIYEPLPDDAYTRVLILEPGRRRQPLRCQLKIVNLEERPDYEAISYVWGSGIKRKKVVCNGARVKITANLLQALVAVRYPSKPRTVWADSISINQNGYKEKGHQVAMMGLIFKRARRVLIHLAGDDRGHAHRVWKFVSEKVTMIRQMPGGTGWDTFPYPSEEETQLVMSDPGFQSVKYLLDHPWFERGWVIQEAVLARDAVIIWGSRITAWLDSLMICHSWLCRRFLSMCINYNVSLLGLLPVLYTYRFRDIAHRLGYHLETKPSLLEILDKARRAKLKDSRDRIYAFLYLDGLDDWLDVAVDATSRLTIQPDYSKPVFEVYADFARHCVKSGDIKWLHYVQHTQESLVQKGIVSWVPRWDVREHRSLVNRPSLPPVMYPSHPTSDNRSKEIAKFDGNCLIVQDVVFDRVRGRDYCSSARARSGFTLDDVASFWRTVKTSRLGSAYPPEHLGLALLTTLTQGLFSGSRPEWMQQREVFWHFLQAIEEDSDTARSFGARIPLVEQCISDLSRGRKLVSTERGYFALAPRITEENDMCCIIFGCCFPFILRELECPSGSKPPSYRVVGDAYIAGTHALLHSEGGMWMPEFGSDDSMEWETWGLEQGDVRLV